MPRGRKGSSGKYELRKRNDISLRDDESLDETTKVLKIGEYNSPLEISNSELRVNGDLFLNGKLSSHTIECDSDYLEFRPNIYTRFESSDYTGNLDLYVASGDSYFLTSGTHFNFLSETAGTFKMGSLATSTDIFIFDIQNTKITIKDDADTGDRFDLVVGQHGATTISTTDDDATAAHLTLQPNGDLVLDPDSQKISINATDGLYFDGGGDTFINESSADVLDIVVGADNILRITESGADGNTIKTDACIGFVQKTPTYDATDTAVDFRHSNKQNLTFGSGSITNVQLFFPLVSGNFQLLIKQDGTGSRTITNYKVYEFDETAADGSNAVKFAGGSNPTLTTDANHVDILSFYWDADNEIAYGVATLDFQF